MIEMCFVLMLIQICLLLTTFHYPSTERIQIKKIEEVLKKVQLDSITNMIPHEIKINKSTLTIDQQKIDLSPLVCDTISFHYNEKGNISQANHFDCQGKKRYARFVFQLGSGWMRIEK